MPNCELIFLAMGSFTQLLEIVKSMFEKFDLFQEVSVAVQLDRNFKVSCATNLVFQVN